MRFCCVRYDTVHSMLYLRATSLIPFSSTAGAGVGGGEAGVMAPARALPPSPARPACSPVLPGPTSMSE